MKGVAKIPVSAAVRTAAGIAAGDQLDVAVELDDDPRDVALPADLSAALAAEPAAQSFYDQLSRSRQHAYVTWVEAAKKPKTRQGRLAETVTALVEGRAQR